MRGPVIRALGRAGRLDKSTAKMRRIGWPPVAPLSDISSDDHNRRGRRTRDATSPSPTLWVFRERGASHVHLLPEVRVGDPIRHESLAVFPLFSTVDARVDYLLSDEAILAGSVAVEEVSEGGSVPDLLVTNSGDSRVLFLEGEELRGAKQNRVLNTSVLVAAHSKTRIPVSCVEQGRWRYRSKQFASSDSHSSSKLRHILKKSAYASMKEGRGYTSDQMAVWSEVEPADVIAQCLLPHRSDVRYF